MKRQSNSPEEILREVYRDAVQGKLDKIEKIIEEIPNDIDLEMELNGLTPDVWSRVVQRVNKERTIARMKSVAGISFACVVFVSAGAMGVWWRLRATQTPAPANLAVSSVAPTIIQTQVVPTHVEATATVEPTSIPDSKYLVSDAERANISPPLPRDGSDAYYLLDYQTAELNPPSSDNSVWNIAKPQEGGPFFYSNSNTSGVTATWYIGKTPQSGDSLFNVSGYYQVFVVDTLYYSSGDIPYTVSVLKDGAVQNGRLAYGEEVAHYDNSATGSQQAETWLSLGIYSIHAGEGLKIETRLPGTGKDYLAVDRLLLTRLGDQEAKLLETLAAASGSNLLSVADESNATFEAYLQGTWAEAKNWVSQSSKTVWGGQFLFLPMVAHQAVRVTWDFPGVFRIGKYQIYALIPDNYSTAMGALYSVRGGNPVRIDQNNQGAWVHVGDAVLSKEETISVVLLFSSPPEGDIGVDAVALVRTQ